MTRYFQGTGVESALSRVPRAPHPMGRRAPQQQRWRGAAVHPRLRAIGCAVVAALLAMGAGAVEVTAEPGDDLQSAVDEARGASGERGRVTLAPGTYVLSYAIDVEDVDIVGAGAGESVLLGSGAIIGSVVNLRVNASLQDVTIRVSPEYDHGFLTLVRMEEPAPHGSELVHVELIGGYAEHGQPVSGVFVFEGNANEALILGCVLSDLYTGLFTRGSGVNVTRSVFQQIESDAIVVGLPISKGGQKIDLPDGSQSGRTVPLLGLADNIEETGLNTIDVKSIGGNAFLNETGLSVLAENNYWGTDDQAAVDAAVEGPVTIGPIIGKAIGPGSVVVSVLDPDAAPVPDSAGPQCSLDGAPGERDATSLNYIFSNVAQGQVTVSASATGFSSDTRTVQVEALTATPVALQLAPLGDGAPSRCGATDKTAYALSALIVIEASRRYRRRARSNAARTR